MSEVFLDTVGLVALWDESDQWHAAAERAMTEVVAQRARCVTTSYVLLECGNAAARRPYRQSVVRLRDRLVSSRALIEPADEDIEKAWAAYARGEADQAGIVDHVSLLVMRRLGISRAFTNDRHFRAAGFETLF